MCEGKELKKIISIISVICLCCILVGCKKTEVKNFKIVTSCYPMYIMTLNLAKDIPNVEVVNMCDKNTGCLHNFQLKSEDLKKIESSSAFVINGAGMESFLDKVVDELPSVKIINSSTGIKLLKDECECHEVEEEHCHHEYNPHIWMSVSNYIKQVQNVTEGLKNIDSIHSNEYEKNAKDYESKLIKLKNDIQNSLKDVSHKEIITFHEAFPYFANEFGLKIAGVINHEPDDEPSTKELKDIIKLIKEKNIKSLFVEPQYPQEIAFTISKETGAKVYTLDSGVTGESSLDAYINAMEKNREVLLEALK